MLTFYSIVLRLLEAVAVTVAVYVITKMKFDYLKFGTMFMTFALSFFVLDLFAPRVAVGARQGAGFGLGYAQFAGSATPNPRQYYENQVVEGMSAKAPQMTEGPNLVVNQKQIPSIILQQFAKSPFVNEELAPYPH